MKKVLGKASLLVVLASGVVLASQSAKADTAYTIQPGDSFYGIAQVYGVDPNQLAASNGLGIYDLIVPGQVINIPGANPAPAAQAPAQQAAPAQTTTTYTVQYGDSFSSIAAAHGMDYNQLAANNGMSIYDYLIPGQTLQVTSQAPAQSAATPASSSYYLPGFTYEPGNTYPVGQCTWAVKKLTGWAGDWWGNASTWATNAAREGFAVGTTPVVGAIAVWDDGSYGHVAYVVAVESDTRIQVQEANYAGKQWIDNYRGWFNPQIPNTKLSYIYPR